MTKTESSSSIGDASPMRLLSPEETAQRLGGIPLVRLDRWRREGRLDFVQLTLKTIGYPEPAVLRFIEENLHPATREPAKTLGKPKSAEHKRRIAEAQKAAWARRKAEADVKAQAALASDPPVVPPRPKAKNS